MSANGAAGAQSPGPIEITGGGTPTEEEVAAIMAAVEVLWPRPVAPETGRKRPPAWRFSGRWWSRPATARRSRPWIVAGE